MNFLAAYQTELLIGLALIVLVQMLLIFSINSRLGRISKLLRSLVTGPTGEDLEAKLARCLAESEQAMERSTHLEQRLSGVADEMQGCVQRMGLVRYDAFGDVRGEQSFSLALLDGQNYGTIITALFGRNDSRFFGKSIRAGKPDQTLSEEENQALQMALEGGIGALPVEPAVAVNGKRRAARRTKERQEQSA